MMQQYVVDVAAIDVNYGMDDESLNRNRVKFECEKFKISDYYLELEAKAKRKSFKII